MTQKTFYDILPKNVWKKPEEGCFLYTPEVGVACLSLPPSTPLSAVVFPDYQEITTINDFLTTLYLGEFMIFAQKAKETLAKKINNERDSLIEVYKRWQDNPNLMADEKKKESIENSLEFLLKDKPQLKGIQMGINDNSDVGRTISTFHILLLPVYKDGLLGMGTAAKNYYHPEL